MEPGEFIPWLASSRGQHLVQSVRPLAVPDERGEQLIAAGSSVLLWHSGHRYLITAAHVIELYLDRVCYVADDSKWVDPDGLDYQTSLAPDGRDKDRLDFAFVRLPPRLADGLVGCHFLTADQIGTHEQLEHDSIHRAKYLVMGYPLSRFKASRVRRVTETPSLTFVGGVASLATHAARGLDPRASVLVEHDARAVIGQKGVQSSPSLKGLSGGGLFRMPGLEHFGDVAPSRLGAITVERWPEHDVILGTRIDVILAAIDNSSGSGDSTA